MHIPLFFIPLTPMIWVYPVFILLLYLRLGLDLMKGKGWRGNLENVDGFVFIFLVLCSYSFLNVDLFYRSPQNYLRYYFSTYLFPVLAYFALRLVKFTDERIRKLRKAALASGILFSLSCLFEFAFSHPLVSEFDNADQWVDGSIYRAGSLVGGSVVAGEMAAFFIALTIPFILFKYPAKRHHGSISLLCILSLGLGVTLSRAGYVSALACVLFAALCLRGRQQGKLVVSLACLLLLIMVMPHLPLPDWLVERLLSQSSTEARIPRFWAGVYFIEDNFRTGWVTALLGRGYIASYLWGGDYFVGLNRLSTQDEIYGSFLSGGFHNGYLTLLVDQGLLAFGCYMVIVVEALRRTWRYCLPFRLLEKPFLKSLTPLEPVAWGLLIIVHLVTETVHWSTSFPTMVYFFVALAMVFNLTSPAGSYNPCVASTLASKRDKRVSSGLAGALRKERPLNPPFHSAKIDKNFGV